MFDTVQAALAASSGAGFRVLHFSVQTNHVHLLVEADDASGFTRGCQGLAIRVAKAVNRVLARRGPVWGDRFHAHWLETPREVRAALVYVLQNWRKHNATARGLDQRSSARWFDGWTTPVASRPPSRFGRARTWLARVGWLRHGLIAPWEVPRGAPG